MGAFYTLCSSDSQISRFLFNKFQPAILTARFLSINRGPVLMYYCCVLHLVLVGRDGVLSGWTLVVMEIRGGGVGGGGDGGSGPGDGGDAHSSLLLYWCWSCFRYSSITGGHSK